MKVDALFSPCRLDQRAQIRQGDLHLRSVFSSSSYYYCLWSTPSRAVAPSAFDLREILISTPSHENVRKWRRTTRRRLILPARAGSKQWTQALWKEFGIINTTISSHDAQLPMPTNQQRLAVLEGDKVLYEAPLRRQHFGRLRARILWLLG